MTKILNAFEAFVRKNRENKADSIILGMVIALVLFGIIMIFSSSYYVAMARQAFNNNIFHFTVLQARAVGLGVVAMVVASFIDYRKLKVLIPIGYVVACGLLFYTWRFTEAIHGARRWMTVAGINFQPSELAMVMMVLMLSLYLSSRKYNGISVGNKMIGLIGCAAIIAIPTFLIQRGGNMSAVIVMAVVGCIIIFVASKHWFLYIVPAGVGGWLIWRIVYDIAVVQEGGGVQGSRIRTWLDPFAADPDASFQIRQSLLAVASGGWFGLGLGQSNLKQQGLLPEAYNDFIFAIIVEETGLFGALIVLLLFGVIVWRGVVIARNAPDMFGALIAIGAVSLIAIQVLINAAVVINLIPNTGSPMPFISYGGTSVMFNLALMGVLLNVSRYAKGNVRNKDVVRNDAEKHR